MTNNSYQDVVLARYPHAAAKHHEPIRQLGQSAPYQEGYWSIISAKEMGATELGRGDTEEEAWENAASNLGGP
jgi:hypothetical protein